jgi:hypothetical protein
MSGNKSIADKIREAMDICVCGSCACPQLRQLLAEHPELEAVKPRPLSVEERYLHLKAKGDDKIHMSGVSGYLPGQEAQALEDQHRFLDQHGAPRTTFESKE